MDDGRVQQNLQENDHPLGEENEDRLEAEQRLREWKAFWEDGGRHAQELAEKVNELVEAYSERLFFFTTQQLRDFFYGSIRENMLRIPERGLAQIVEDIHQWISQMILR